MHTTFWRVFGLFAAIGLLVFASGCKDDEAVPSKRGLLTGKTWSVTKYQIGELDITDDREECEFDNTTIFFSDGTFKDDMGAVLCDEFETDVDGSWVFKANETILSLQPAGESASDWDILELTDDKLRISQYVQIFSSTVVVTMEPK